ncbi:MAG: translocation/assembly module TamB [Bacteroidetes bacterium]|nr:translocation/assembly module TamB [Bacteroidota bacterium]
MLRKITRILVKTTGILFLLIVLLGVSLYFGVQSYTFQTWLGKKAGNYLSDELHTTITIQKIQLDFFTKARLEGVFVADLHKDTLLKGDLSVDIKELNFNAKRLVLDKVIFSDMKAKLITYKGDSTLNYQFLYDYFVSGSKKKDTAKGWDVRQGDIVLDNLGFTYKNENEDTKVTRNMNFNFLDFDHTSGVISDLKISTDTIFANIKKLTTREQSGFELSNLTTNLKISSKELLLEELYLKTPRTLLKGKVDFIYNDWGDYSDFINKINIRAQLLDSSHVSFTDIASFTSELNGLDKTVYLSGNVKGPVSDLNLKDFNLTYGDYTRFRGNLTLSGLPDFSNSYLHFDAKEISSNYKDLIQIPTYPFIEGKKLELPIQVKQLGTISYKGKFDGFIGDFTTYGTFKTALGNLTTNLSVKLGKKLDDIQYRGKLKTQNFNLGALAGSADLKTLSLNAEVKGRGISLKALNVDVEGNILSVVYNNYDYKNIVMNGSIKEKIFNGLLMSKDPNADFDFNGSINFQKKVPAMDFISTVNRLDLKKLNFSKEEGSISTQVLIVLHGDNINNISGDINFDNTIFKNAKKEYKFSTFDLKLDQETADKTINVNSSYFNLAVDGRFNVTNLPPAFHQFLVSYYPAFFKKVKSKTVYTDDLKFKLTIKKFDVIRELFVPDLMISPGAVINGEFDVSKNLININSKSDSIRFKTIKFHNNVVESYSQNNKINLVFKGSDIQLSDSIKLNNYFIYFVSKDKDTKYNLEWDNKLSPKNAGKVMGKASFASHMATLSLDKFFITSRDSTWNLTSANPTIVDTSGTIIVNPLLFTNNNQSIGIAGTLSGKPGDSLVINTENVLLQQFNPLLKLIKLELEGSLSGRVTLHDPKNFGFSSDLNFEKFKINKNAVGKLVVQTSHNSAEKNIFMDGYTSLGFPSLTGGDPEKNISFRGYYYFDKKEESIDIDFKAAPANLKLLNPLLEGVLTINNALVTGGGKIHGSPDNLKIDGKLKLYNAEIKVDYTNVTYNMTGEVEIMPDQIRFSDLLMKVVDPALKNKGLKAAPQGTINGNIFHTNFTRIQLDYDVTYRNMLVLNTTQKENKTFYGKIYGSGNIGIWGFLNNLHMQVIDTTTKGSKFFLPLDGPSEVAESDFITFVKRDTVKPKPDVPLTGFNLDMYVTVTPEAQMQIIMDSKAGDVLNVQGTGDLNLRINTLGKFEMFGDYIMTNGDYLFTLENVINKKFDIDAGSNISWSGDPLAAEINIVTSYKQRASVAALLNDTTGRYKGRFPVDCKLKISDKLFSPNINFAIEFPSIDATARARINNILSDEAELNRQVFSFLLFRTFVTPQIYNNSSGGVTAGSAAASTGSEMLSNRLSSFLNNYVGNLTGLNDLEVGLNYRAGSGTTTGNEVDLALSKQLFNNKVSIDGNFGVNNNQSNRNSSGIIDVNIEYKLTEDGKYRVKGFNRSNNTTQITTTGGPYTQGIGLFYREEFETINQLFQRYLVKFKKKEVKVVPPPSN